MENWKERLLKLYGYDVQLRKRILSDDRYAEYFIPETSLKTTLTFIDQEIKKARKEGEEFGYRRGCIDTCEIYEDCKGDKEGTLRFWKEKQIKLKNK